MMEVVAAAERIRMTPARSCPPNLRLSPNKRPFYDNVIAYT